MRSRRKRMRRRRRRRRRRWWRVLRHGFRRFLRRPTTARRFFGPTVPLAFEPSSVLAFVEGAGASFKTR